MGSTMLSTACYGGSSQVVRALVDANADVNQYNRYYRNILLQRGDQTQFVTLFSR